MHFFESLLYVGSVLFVIVYLIALAVLMSSDNGRRTLVLALRSLRLHKLRAMLSVLGIIIGTGAVIALMAIGEGSMQDALAEIKRMGATNIIVKSVKPPDDISTQSRTFVARYGITQEDFDLFATIPTVVRMVPMRAVFPKPIYHDEYMFNGRIVATIPEYKDANQLREAVGRFLVERDSLEKDNVCVLGARVAAKLFPNSSPLDQTILIDKFDYHVVGVVEERMPVSGGTGGSQSVEDFNNDVYVPLGTAGGRWGKTVFLRQTGSRSGEQVEYSQVTLTVAETDDVRPAGQAIKTILDRHPRRDTTLFVPLDKLEQAEHEKDRFTMLMLMTAIISLAVGGIGIMNIMLATVTERTREIGIRRALGAKRRDIITQFLIEAIVQTTVGGLIGLSLGLLFVPLAPWVATHVFHDNLPTKLHVLSIFVSLAAAALVGVAFGLYPAYRAALLDPIEALRHE